MSAATSSRELTEIQHRAVRAILVGDSDAVVAHACGISGRTLRDWRTRPEFRAALEEGRHRLLQAVCAQVAAAATEAVRTLAEISQNPSERSSVRVAAAGKLLNFLLRSGSLGTSPAECCAPVSAPSPNAEQLLAFLASSPTANTEPTTALPQAPPPPTRPSAPEAEASASPADPSHSDLLLRRLDQHPARIGHPAAPSALPSRPFRELPIDAGASHTPERSLTLKVPVAAC